MNTISPGVQACLNPPGSDKKAKAVFISPANPASPLASSVIIVMVPWQQRSRWVQGIQPCEEWHPVVITSRELLLFSKESINWFTKLIITQLSAYAQSYFLGIGMENIPLKPEWLLSFVEKNNTWKNNINRTHLQEVKAIRGVKEHFPAVVTSFLNPRREKGKAVALIRQTYESRCNQWESVVFGQLLDVASSVTTLR